MDYSVFDRMIEGVQVVDVEWRYIYVNDALTRQGKYSREELLGNTMMEKYPGIDQTKMFDHLRRCMETHQAHRMENEFEFPDGTKGWFELRIERVEDGILIMSFDITKQKRLEMELRHLNEALEMKVKERTKELIASLDREKELSEMKNAFVSMASHEFRTPLSTILSSTSLVEKYKEMDESEKFDKHLKRIRSAVNNLAYLLDDFLSLEKMELGVIKAKKHKFELKAFLFDVVESLEGMRKRDQYIHIRHTGNREVFLDQQILRNIMINLISNALKYSDKDVFVEANASEQEVVLSVRDRGIGIPLEQQGELFTTFFRASNTGEIEGTGLGLTIVKHYLELLNGRIEFSSQEKKGSTFQVRIPCNSAQ